MGAGQNRYRANLRELDFVLFEQFRLGEVLEKAPFEGFREEDLREMLKETYRFVREVLGPLDASGDREGCTLVGGEVRTPAGFKEAWSKVYEAGFKTLSLRKELGGQGAPHAFTVLVDELLSGANVAFSMYPGLASGAADLIAECGTAAQKQRYVGPMTTGRWGGTMCLTEPHAGSDVGAARSVARRQADGRYKLHGTKMFISGGDHDLAENIIHLVLARIDGAPAGTKGLSLFIVPKFRIGPSGERLEPNDVQVASIEHKMGINASATCVLNFGENDDCFGELVGGVEHAGIAQMFTMMNGARIEVGVQSVAVAAAAYHSALEYAKERKQGAHFRHWKDPTQPRVAIIEHPDVRRMLLDAKAHVEGMRALIVKLASHNDRAHALAGVDPAAAAYHHGQVELLTPLVKMYSSEEAFRICAQCIQVFGGAGFLEDHPVEQHCRDSKIFSIYEGTSHIQAMDLVGRKLAQADGAYLRAFMKDVTAFIKANHQHERLAAEIEILAAAQTSLGEFVKALPGWQSKKLHLVPLTANGFLTAFSRLAVGWLLLDAAVLAHRALQASPKESDRAFYEGKLQSALYYARQLVRLVPSHLEALLAEDGSPMDIPDAAFASDA